MPTSPTAARRSDEQLELDACLRRIADVTRKLPSLTARLSVKEARAELAARLASGRPLQVTLPDARPIEVPRRAFADLRRARALVPNVPEPALHAARLEELELELELLAALGDTKRVRQLLPRRYPTGATPAVTGEPLRAVAARLLALPPVAPTPREVPATEVAERVQAVAQAAGLEVRVVIEARLVANAAAGERTVFLADRTFGDHEAWRTAAHEVLGHLCAAANARAQPMAIAQVGTPGSFADQEGLALTIEERIGRLDLGRVRTLAARVWVTDRVLEGARFEDVAQLLHAEHGFAPRAAVALAERGFRGGGLTRDACYLLGWLRVRDQIARHEGDLETLWLGRTSVEALPALRRLLLRGLLRAPLYVPSLRASPAATALGTSSSTLPPSLAASLMRLDET